MRFRGLKPTATINPPLTRQGKINSASFTRLSRREHSHAIYRVDRSSERLKGRFNVLFSFGLSQIHISPLKRAENHWANDNHALKESVSKLRRSSCRILAAGVWRAEVARCPVFFNTIRVDRGFVGSASKFRLF